ncbi:MAG: hypothetical protein ACRYG2_13405 [Janthinobacterium lividum]
MKRYLVANQTLTCDALALLIAKQAGQRAARAAPAELLPPSR